METKRLRHAYLIITHGSFPILEKQLRFLDSENADFFIHLDTHVKDFDFDYYRSIPKHSSVTFVDRIRISWGHYSLAECEMILLKAAVMGQYDYYHLLSGVDVPVKSRSYIESYFLRAPGRNYINYQMPVLSRDYADRVRFSYPFQRWNIRNRVIRTGIRLTSNAVQRVLGVDRTRKYDPGFVFQKGTQWFSITHELAAYLLAHEEEIREKFHSTFCSDEMFLHSLVVNSPFRDTLPPGDFQNDYACCLRYIDWTRGKPYVFTDADYEELISTGPDHLFARKFDCVRNGDLVDRLFAHFGEPEA